MRWKNDRRYRAATKFTAGLAAEKLTETESKVLDIDHTMSVVVNSVFGVVLKLVCSDHESLNCHYVCNDCTDQGIESWDFDDHVFPDRRNGVEVGHQLTYRTKCSAIEWFEDTAEEHFYVGENDVPIWDGMPVEVFYNGDSYVWKTKDVKS